MADKINFRRGSQEEITSAFGKYEKGSFYLATDEGKLYYGLQENQLIQIGTNPFHWGSEPPNNAYQLWIHTHPTKGGLKFYNSDLKEWVHVPVAFTSRGDTNTDPEIPTDPETPTTPVFPTEPEDQVGG